MLVDVDPDHLLIDPEKVRAAVTDRTRAILPVHLYGQVAPVERLHGIAESCGAVIVEDAAQAHGATRLGRAAGTLGSAAGTSFYPGKNLGAAGDAGAVITDDENLADTVRLLGAHGSRLKYEHDVVGMNSRLDTIQAVVLLAKLRRLACWNQSADGGGGALWPSCWRAVPSSHREARRGTRMPGTSTWCASAERDRVLQELTSAGIGAGIHYPTPLHLTRAFASPGYPRGSFPVAEQAAAEILSLPIYPHITPEQQERVVAALLDSLGGAP